MSAKKPQQVKKQEPQQNMAPVPEVQPEPASARTTTTVQVRIETKGRLESLKEVMRVDDFDGVIQRLINTIPERLSTEEEKHLVMTASKYRWLMAKQDSCDCRQALADAVR